jgi:aryl-alcohol dehydrogenase-like predicted oxidoreductase
VLNRIGLGTAQLGLDYGVANVSGRPTSAESHRIMACAVDAGIGLLDTARAYGSSEAVIGDFVESRGLASQLRVVSKLGSRKDGRFRAAEFLEELRSSLASTRVRRMHAWLVHDVHDAVRDPREFAAAAEQAKAEGLARFVGASVYTAADLEAVMEAVAVDVVQVPLSLLDQRLLRDGSLDAIRRAGVEVHARSLFLQGALLMSPESLPESLAGLSQAVARVRSAAARCALTPYELSLAFAHETRQVDYWIVGSEQVSQVRELISGAARAGDFAGLAAGLDYADLAANAEPLIDPRTWSRP